MCTGILGYRTGNLSTRCFWKQTKFLKKTRKGVLFLSETHPKHRKHIPTIIPDVSAPAIHMETITINWFSKLIKWFLQHLQKHRENETLMEQCSGGSTILVIIFWKFVIFQDRLDSPQVNPSLISSITNSVYKLPHELLNDVRFRNLGNVKKISNFGEDMA